MIRRPPGWMIQWSISERSSPCSRRKPSATAGSPAPARSGSSRARCRWLSVGVMSSLTASSVPASWCTREARIEGAGGVPSESGSGSLDEQRRRAAVAEDRRADGLRARVLGGGAHQRAAHALRGDDERVLARVLAQRLGGELHQRHAARAADAGDVVLVGRRVHLVVVDEPVGERRAAERVEARAHHGADLAGVDRERVDRANRVLQQLPLDPRRAALRRVREELVAEVEVTALDAAAFEDALGERVPLQPQPLEHLLLRVAVLGVRDGDPGDPRARQAETARRVRAPGRMNSSRLARRARSGLSGCRRDVEASRADLSR